MSKKTELLLVLVLLIVVVGVGVYVSRDHKKQVYEPEVMIEPEVTADIPSVTTEMIGSSVEGRDIKVTTLGQGDTHLLFVGGVHGGYEWNSSLSA